MYIESSFPDTPHPFVTSLDHIAPEARTEMGAKAVALARLRSIGVHVPPGYVLGRSYLWRLLEANGATAEFVHLTHGDAVLYRSDKLHTLITALEFPERDRETLALCAVRLGWPIVVRSSAPDEDTMSASQAGLYTSVPDVTDEAALLQAVLDCFASAFSHAAFLHSPAFGQGTAVILQDYVRFDTSGVAFSRHPLTGDPDHIVVNLGEEGVEAIVSGRDTGRVVTVAKSDARPDVPGLRPETATALVDAVRRIETAFEQAVDVEWGVAGGTLHVVQARPITTVAAQPAEAPCIVDVDDLQHCAMVDLGALEAAHLRWMGKKHVVRTICRKHSIPVPPVWYVVVPDSESRAREVVERLLERASGAYLEVYDGTEHTIVPRTALASACRDARHTFRTRTVLRVQEYQPNDACGHATQTAEGNIYVETLPGSFHSFWQEGLRPTTYLLAPDGTVLSTDIASVPYYVAFDEETCTYRPCVPDEPIRHTLSPAALRQVATLNRHLAAELGEVRIEWIHHDGTVYFFDLSEESRSLTEIQHGSTVLSAGYAEGPLCIVGDLSVLDRLFEGGVTDVDVVPNESFRRTLHAERTQDTITTVLDDLERPIVVAEFPKRTLAVLTDVVSGFIFERGGLLCHLAIILREQGVPAVVVPDARQRFTHGEQVKITHGHVVRG